MDSGIQFRKPLPFSLQQVRSYFLSGDLLKRTTVILTLLDIGYAPHQAYRLLQAFDENLTQEAWDEMVCDAFYLDRLSPRPRLGVSQEPARKSG
jgi:hypothetical protein